MPAAASRQLGLVERTFILLFLIKKIVGPPQPPHSILRCGAGIPLMSVSCFVWPLLRRRAPQQEGEGEMS